MDAGPGKAVQHAGVPGPYFAQIWDGRSLSLVAPRKPLSLTVTRVQTNTSGGHFLKEDIAAFDAGFFGINPVEAMVSTPITSGRIIP